MCVADVKWGNVIGVSSDIIGVHPSQSLYMFDYFAMRLLEVIGLLVVVELILKAPWL